MNAGSFEIIEAGSTQVTDLGRSTGPRFGVAVNGALDQRSARIANILVGNPESAPLLEITALDVEFTPDIDILIAVTGADGHFSVDGVGRPANEPVSVRAGQSIVLQQLQGGLRAYLAVRGSFDAPLLLGSCAPDTVLGFSGRLVTGSSLPLRRATAPIFNDHFSAELYNLDVPRLPTAFVVDVVDGPDIADFADTAGRLFEQPYLVTPTSNHIGLRMTGPLPERRASGEVLSRGVPVGAVEVPPGDELLVLHRGRGVTAGYPVLAVVTAESLDVLAQVRPGQRLRFRRVTTAEAAARARAELVRLETLRLRIQSVFAALDALTLTTTGRTLL